jgi:hypothetical protein
LRAARNVTSLVSLVALVAVLSACRKRDMPAPAESSSAAQEGERAAGSGSHVTSPALAASPPRAGESGALPAFPGAEGFGAYARGGRGGPACLVTTLAKAGPGSLAACLEASGPRVVVFRVGGVVEGPLDIVHGRLTIAGQTAPGGITVKGGLRCDNVYDAHDCADLVIRHVRLRGGDDDGMRLGGTHDVVLDHVSIANAADESLEITRSHHVTVQYSTFSEPAGEHYKWGGVLVNYSKDVMPLDAITLHHDVWNGVSGRLPELSCEENDDGPGKSACKGHSLSVELASNVMFDVHDPVWFNRCTKGNAGNDCPASEAGFSLEANVVGNLLVRRGSEDADAPFVEPVFLSAPGNHVYFANNRVGRGGSLVAAPGPSIAARHPFPAVRASAPDKLLHELAASAGAFPRDAMDSRLAGYLSRPVDTRPVAWKNERGLVVGDAFTVRPAASAPADTDADGIPDAWELAHGLDPRVDDAKNLGFASGAGAKVPGCTRGYTALECYVNELAEGLLH